MQIKFKFSAWFTDQRMLPILEELLIPGCFLLLLLQFQVKIGLIEREYRQILCRFKLLHAFSYQPWTSFPEKNSWCGWLGPYMNFALITMVIATTWCHTIELIILFITISSMCHSNLYACCVLYKNRITIINICCANINS